MVQVLFLTIARKKLFVFGISYDKGHKSWDKEDRLRIKMKKFAIILDKSERLVYNKCIAWLHRGNISKVHERANAIWRDWIW